MNTKTRMASTVKFVNNDLAAKLTSTLPRWPAKQWQSFGSSNGADVILSTENGIKVAFHKVIVERFTNIFDALESANIEELRDPFGSLVIILPGVEYETLQALSHLLYAGECHVNFMGGREALEAILDPSVKEKVTGHSWLSPALKDEPVAEPPTTTVPEQEVTEVQDGDEESPQLTDEPAEDQNASFRLNLSDDSDEDECSTNELVNIEVEEEPSTEDWRVLKRVVVKGIGTMREEQIPLMKWRMAILNHRVRKVMPTTVTLNLWRKRWPMKMLRALTVRNPINITPRKCPTQKRSHIGVNSATKGFYTSLALRSIR